MKLILNSESMQFQAASAFEARLDKDGVHRRDKSGGTNLPLYAVKLVAWSDADAETILVTVPVATRRRCPRASTWWSSVWRRCRGCRTATRGWRFAPSPSSRSTAPPPSSRRQ